MPINSIPQSEAKHMHTCCLSHTFTPLLTYQLCLSRKWCRARGKQKQIMECKMTNTYVANNCMQLITMFDERPLTCTTIHHPLNVLSNPTSLYHFPCNTLRGYYNSHTRVWSKRMQFPLPPTYVHHLHSITNMLDTESLKAHNNRSTQCLSTPYHSQKHSSCTHAASHTHSHHYSLTACVCPGNGAVQEENKSK